MVVHMLSEDGSRDQLYLSNYARTQVVDRLARLDGVGRVQLFAERAFSMRVWLDPERIAARSLTAGEIVQALRANNLQVASGVLNELPVPEPGAFQLNVQTLGRLIDPAQFENIVVKTTADGRTVRVRDIGRVELGAQSYTNNGYLNDAEALPMIIFQRPGSNALATAEAVINSMDQLAAEFPPGVNYRIVYNPTEFIAESIDAVYVTIFEAVALVILVAGVFTELAGGDHSDSGHPGVAGRHLCSAGGGRVLAEYFIAVRPGAGDRHRCRRRHRGDRKRRAHIQQGMNPRDAAYQTMTEVSGALVAIALVLSAVFIPTAFISGISGQFYQQFAIHPSHGTIDVLGERLGHTDTRTLRRRLGFTSAALGDMLRPTLTSEDVVTTGLYGDLAPWWHRYTEANRIKARQLLNRFGCGSLAGAQLGTLSSGERQRVLLARTLMNDPVLWLLDEPTAGLDLRGREQLVSLLGQITADLEAPTTIMVTHHVDEIPPGFTHLLLLKGGTVLAAGPIDQILTAERLSACFEVPLRLEKRDGRWLAWSPPD